MTFTIRPPRVTDQGFVAKTWATSLVSMQTDRSTPSHVWRELFAPVNKTIDGILDDTARTRLKIACDAQRTDDVFGWLCYAPMKAARLLHYVYVRKRRRGQGIARALMAAAGMADDRPLWWTMKGPSGDELIAKMRTTCIHVPVKEYLAA